MTPTDSTLSRLRFLITESSKAAGITVSVPMINRIADEMLKLLHSDRMLLIWQETLDEALRSERLREEDTK